MDQEEFPSAIWVKYPDNKKKEDGLDILFDICGNDHYLRRKIIDMVCSKYNMDNTKSEAYEKIVDMDRGELELVKIAAILG